MSGPAVTALRAALVEGCSLDDARRISPLAWVEMQRLAKVGALETCDRGMKLRQHLPDPAIARQRQATADLMAAAKRSHDERRAFLDRQQLIHREKEAAQRRLWANVGQYREDEKRAVIAERTQALREMAAILGDE